MGKGRAPCCDKAGVKRGTWSEAEDLKLISFIRQHGHSNWRALPRLAGLARCGKSCRLRWVNYLCPDIKRGYFTLEEEQAIMKLHEQLGNKWSKIASLFPGRTDNEIKNVWNTHLKKRLAAKQSKTSTSKSDSTVTSSSNSSTSNELKFSNGHDNLKEGDMSKQASLKDMIEIPLEANTEFLDLLEADFSSVDSNTPLSGIEAELNLALEEDNIHNDMESWSWFLNSDTELLDEPVDKSYL